MHFFARFALLRLVLQIASGLACGFCAGACDNSLTSRSKAPEDYTEHDPVPQGDVFCGFETHWKKRDHFHGRQQESHRGADVAHEASVVQTRWTTGVGD